MSFVRQVIDDRVVQYPNRFTKTDIDVDTIELVVEPGTITEPGTDVNKALLQRYEDAIDGSVEFISISSSDLTGDQIDLTTIHNNSLIKIKVTEDLVATTAFTISRNGATAKPLKAPNGDAITELLLEQTYFDLVEESTNFFLAPKGGAGNIIDYEFGFIPNTGVGGII